MHIIFLQISRWKATKVQIKFQRIFSVLWKCSESRNSPYMFWENEVFFLIFMKGRQLFEKVSSAKNKFTTVMDGLP